MKKGILIFTLIMISMGLLYAGAGDDDSLRLTRDWKVYVLPQTHLDIGYTHPQMEVLHKQWEHLELAMDLAEQTAGNPEGERMVWNPDGTWAVTLWYRQANDEQRSRFIRLVKKGSIGLSKTFATLQTYVCGPAEYELALSGGNDLEEIIDFPILNGMYSDVPGWSWSTVDNFANNGVRFLSLGPNEFDRVGSIHKTWGDKPYWWVSPSGKNKVLVFQHGMGYSWAHEWGSTRYKEEKSYPFVTRHTSKTYTGDWFVDYLKRLEDEGYPYSSVIIRYNVGQDNGPPDSFLASRVHRFNRDNTKVKLIISSVDTAFKAFESDFGDQLPEFRGDFSGYWEDGCYSGAKETIRSKRASNELESLQIANAIKGFPLDKETFSPIWDNILLHSEHTWGAHCSISRPDSEFTRTQWSWKEDRSIFAQRDTAKVASSFEQVGSEVKKNQTLEVINTQNRVNQRPLRINKNQIQLEGSLFVQSDGGATVFSQRLACGDLLVDHPLAPLSSEKLLLTKGNEQGDSNSSDQPKILYKSSQVVGLTNGEIELLVDSFSGAIKSIRRLSDQKEFVNLSDRYKLGQHIYLYGNNGRTQNSKRIRKISIEKGDEGALSASILVHSKPRGSVSQIMEIRLYKGLSQIDFKVLIDRKKVRTKEALLYAFPFNLPNGKIAYDVANGRVDLNSEMMAGGNRNYFSCNRYVEVSDGKDQVTLVLPDTMMFLTSEITIDARNYGWFEKTAPYNGKIYLYPMNNYWHTNFRADQEGLCDFNFTLFLGTQQPEKFSAQLASEVARPALVFQHSNAQKEKVEIASSIASSVHNQVDRFLAKVKENPDIEVSLIDRKGNQVSITLYNTSYAVSSFSDEQLAAREVRKFTFGEK